MSGDLMHMDTSDLTFFRTYKYDLWRSQLFIPQIGKISYSNTLYLGLHKNDKR
jgi:hypothetical protein